MQVLRELVVETKNHPGLYATIAHLTPGDALVYLSNFCGTRFASDEDVADVCARLIAVLKERRNGKV